MVESLGSTAGATGTATMCAAVAADDSTLLLAALFRKTEPPSVLVAAPAWPVEPATAAFPTAWNYTVLRATHAAVTRSSMAVRWSAGIDWIFTVGGWPLAPAVMIACCPSWRVLPPASSSPA